MLPFYSNYTPVLLEFKYFVHSSQSRRSPDRVGSVATSRGIAPRTLHISFHPHHHGLYYFCHPPVEYGQRSWPTGSLGSWVRSLHWHGSLLRLGLFNFGVHFIYPNLLQYTEPVANIWATVACCPATPADVGSMVGKRRHPTAMLPLQCQRLQTLTQCKHVFSNFWLYCCSPAVTYS